MHSTVRLLTIADGFGDSRAVPAWYPDYIKWPEIIKFMTKNLELTNLSRYGAGNEYIIHSLKNNLNDKDAVLVQWAIPSRLDLVLAHAEPTRTFWQDQINSDPVYYDNVVSLGSDRVWITSGSTMTGVREYHNKFISRRQHQIRSQLYVDYATLLLENKKYGFLLTKTSEYLKETAKPNTNWFCHGEFQGMCEFRHQSEYAELDLGITQPIPLVQFDFIKKFIQPNFDLPWRSERDIQAVGNMLFRKYQEAVKNKPL